MLVLLLALIVTPLAEIAAFIQIGDLIGLWPTLLTVVATAVIGSILLKHQGLRTLKEIQRQLHDGKLPVDEMLAGLCLFAAGLLLLTPGFITDTVGFALLIPAVRLWVARLVRARLGERIVVQAGSPHTGRPFAGDSPPGAGQASGRDSRSGAGVSSTVIDGSYEPVGETASADLPPADGPPAGAPSVDKSQWGRRS